MKYRFNRMIEIRQRSSWPILALPPGRKFLSVDLTFCELLLPRETVSSYAGKTLQLTMILTFLTGSFSYAQNLLDIVNDCKFLM
jgi:hypothetical protein